MDNPFEISHPDDWRGHTEDFLTWGPGQDNFACAQHLLEKAAELIDAEALMVCGLNVSSKWLMSSAWQKAIRRGEVENASLYAQTYHSLDPVGFWRRIPVVAIEDIGIGNPRLVAAIMWVSGKAAWRAKTLPDRAWAAKLSIAMALAFKDRTCCDLVVCAENDPDLAGYREESFKEPFGDRLVSVAADRDAYLLKRLIALWALGGTKVYRGGNDIPEKQASHSGYFASVVGELSHGHTILEWMAVQGGNRTQDAMPLAFMFLLHMALDTPEGEISTIFSAIPCAPKIGVVPPYAFDQHNGAGKRAIKHFAINCAPIRAFLFGPNTCAFESEELALAALGSMVFRVESTILDQRLKFEGSEEVYDLCETARFRQRGIPLHLIGYAREVVTANLAWLNYSRAYVTGKTVPSTSWPTPVTPLLPTVS